MTSIELMTASVVGLALASVLAAAVRGVRSDAELLFALFCGSVAMAMLRPALDGAPALLVALVTLGACATCNVYWLVARALFRGSGGVGRRHVAAAAGIALLIALYRAAEASGGGPRAAVLGDLLALASSTVLVLAFAEALRGWSSALPRAEKRLRIGFMAVYGSCVLLGTTSSAMSTSAPGWADGHRMLVLCCATAVVVGTHLALAWRRRHPVAQPSSPLPPAKAPSASTEERDLGDAILRVLATRELYREPELKVADLAAAVGSAEHKVSRAITQALGERNFNQLVNRHRIAHACRLLAANDGRSVLDVSLDSGFGSLGPFNRAFKAATGCTPTAWRAARQNARPSPDHPSACASS
jgi:AraC-like DNA-binding protein